MDFMKHHQSSGKTWFLIEFGVVQGHFFRGNLTDRVGFNEQSSGIWSLTSHWVVLFVFHANLAALLEFHGPFSVPVPPSCYWGMNNQHQICVDDDAMLMDDLEIVGCLLLIETSTAAPIKICSISLVPCQQYQATPRRKQLVRGKKLIKNYVVGTCTKSYDGVYIKNRGEAKYLSQRDIPSNIEKKRKRGNEDLYGHQQVNLGDDAILVNSGDATLSPPIQSFLYLWDFELVPEAHNENLS
uniref:Uncharacterized protein n=1 Tax=Solanum lycopersicum TaxID=4081 RepID=A0A3Q7EFK1_SOLLC